MGQRLERCETPNELFIAHFFIDPLNVAVYQTPLAPG